MKQSQLLVYVFFLLCILLPSGIYTQEPDAMLFIFKYDDSSKYRIESNNVQTVRKNGNIILEGIVIQNRVVLDIKKQSDSSIQLYTTTEMIEDGLLVSEEYSEYRQNASGHMNVPQMYHNPLVRNIPYFPNQMFVVGDTWESMGEDRILIPSYKEPVPIPVIVSYTYRPWEILPDTYKGSSARDEKYPIIHIEYDMFNYSVSAPTHDVQNAIVNAQFNIKMWWNHTAGRPEHYVENYRIIVTFEDLLLTEIEFFGDADASLYPIKDLDRKTLQQELQKAIPDSTVESNSQGVVISLQDIKFLPESAVLLSSEVEKLQTIAVVLQSFPDRRVLIEGHTALSGTELGRQQLSEERAKVVRDYLADVLQRNNDDLIYRGYGSDRPLSSNTTSKGRSQNRRVEITILEN